MKFPHPSRTLPPRRRDLGWWLRCLLILLLLADQVAAPLHHHHHDSGVDGLAWQGAVLAGEQPAASATGHGGDPTAALYHATTVLRADARAPLDRALAEGEHDRPLLALVAALVLALGLAAGAQRVARPRPPRRPRTLFRSLPPANRAPPALA